MGGWGADPHAETSIIPCVTSYIVLLIGLYHTMLHHMSTGTLYAHYRGYGVEHSPLTAEAQIILKPKDASLSALESV